jgi:hypothetical protein
MLMVGSLPSGSVVSPQWPPCGASLSPLNGRLKVLLELCSISKMYFSHWEPPGVSERRWSVNLEASISGENQTLGGHSGRPSK